MLLTLLMLLSPSVAPAPYMVTAATEDPPIHVWLNSDGNYLRGDRASVDVRSAQGGYLVVLHADPEGHVRVVFPVDPGDDQRIQGGKKYELKGRGGHAAFMVDDTTGRGIVLAALSKTPFKFDDFEQNGRWDYAALDENRVRNDPEAGLMNIVQRMQPAPTHFDYDVAPYVVSSRMYAYPAPYPYWGPWWGYGPRIGLGFWYGPSFYYRWGW